MAASREVGHFFAGENLLKAQNENDFQREADNRNLESGCDEYILTWQNDVALEKVIR